MIYATLETRNYSFVVFAQTEAEAMQSLEKAWNEHTGEAERVAHNAMTNAKRRIRQAIIERTSVNVKRLSYFISQNEELGTGQLARLVIRER
jgi:ribulose bisphosphate carboxylase small subunit